MFQNCRQGSVVSSPSRTLAASLMSRLQFERMMVHTHLDWEPVTADNKLHYPTSCAAYPFLLCTRLVDSVKSKLTESGALDPQNLQEQTATLLNTRRPGSTTAAFMLMCGPVNFGQMQCRASASTTEESSQKLNQYLNPH